MFAEDGNVALCSDCYSSSYGQCEKCKKSVPINELTEAHNGDSYCEKCVPKKVRVQSHPMRWTKILQKIGYSAVQDPGFSIVHKNEPSQGLALGSYAFQILDVLKNENTKRKLSDKYIQKQIEESKKK